MSVVIPSAMSWILASLHVSFGFALVGAVVGEFLGAKEGIGLLISTAQGALLHVAESRLIAPWRGVVPVIGWRAVPIRIARRLVPVLVVIPPAIRAPPR